MVEKLKNAEETVPVVTETTTEVEILKEEGKTKKITRTKTRLRTKTETLRETIGVIAALPTETIESVENTVAPSSENGIDLVKEFNWLTTQNKIIIGSCLGLIAFMFIGAWCFAKFHSRTPPSPKDGFPPQRRKKTRVLKPTSPLSPPDSAGMQRRRAMRNEITRLSDMEFSDTE